MSTPVAFRRLALERLSSPDDLDRVLRVTNPRSWITLTALCGLSAACFVWSVTAVVPLKVNGPGILLKSGGIFELVTGISGRVADVSVGIGDTVKEGQVVARIAQPELVERLQQARIRLANARAAHALVAESGSRELEVQLRGFEQQTEHVRQGIVADETRASFFREKIVVQQQLVKEGRLVRQTLADTVNALESTNQQMRERHDELARLKLQMLQAKSQREAVMQRSLFTVKESESEIAQLERGLTVGAEVRSPYTGRIIEILAEQGNIVQRGESLFTLDLTGRTVAALEAMVYVPAKDGKRVSPGMVVQIAPATVRPEEHGYLLGKVTYVSDLPATARAMLRVLKNEALVQSLTGSTPPHEVHVDLLPDGTTASGFRWSSSQGPAMAIQSGTLCEAAVIVESRRPLEMVLPFLRKSLHL